MSPTRLAKGLTLALLLGAGQSALAMTCFVSPSGNDSNDGQSVGTAWRTLAKVSGRAFLPGDVVLLQGGSTFTGPLSLDQKHTGISVGSYGTDRAIISGGNQRGVSVYNVAGVTLTSLVVRGDWNSVTQSGNSQAGVDVYADRQGGGRFKGLTLRNLEVSGFKRGGILIGAYPANMEKSGFEDVLVEDCELHDNAESGLAMFGPFNKNATGYAHRNVTVRRCKAFNNRGVLNSGSHSGSGIVLSDVQGAVVERCLAYNNGEFSNSPAGGPVGIWCWDSDQVVIQHCESYGNRTQTIDGGGFDLDGGVTNSVLQYNYSHDNDGAGYLICQFTGARPFHDNSVRFNISENDGRRSNYGGLVFFDGEGDFDSCDVYNNTVFVAPSANGSPCAVKFINKSPNVRLRNNLFVTESGLTLVHVTGQQPGILFQGNCYWSSGSPFKIEWQGTTFDNLGAWRSATNQEKVAGVSTGHVLDPLLMSFGQGGVHGDPAKIEEMGAYRLSKKSPLIHKGLNLTQFGLNPGTKDFFGGVFPFGTKCDVGAHEFQPRSKGPGQLLTSE